MGLVQTFDAYFYAFMLACCFRTHCWHEKFGRECNHLNELRGKRLVIVIDATCEICLHLDLHHSVTYHNISQMSTFLQH